MDDTWAQLGVGGAIAYLILKEVFTFLRALLTKSSDATATMRKQIDDIYQLHTQADDDGTPFVYVPRSLSQAIDRLADNVEAQTKLLRSQAHDDDDHS